MARFAVKTRGPPSASETLVAANDTVFVAPGRTVVVTLFGDPMSTVPAPVFTSVKVTIIVSGTSSMPSSSIWSVMRPVAGVPVPSFAAVSVSFPSTVASSV